MSRTMLITVPHAVNTKNEICYVRDMCDSKAQVAANVFEKIANSYGYKCLIVVGDINRKNLDLNRKESRFNSIFRTKIRKSTFDFAIDMHSFPPEETWGLSYHPNAIALFDYNSNDEWMQPILSKLSNIVILLEGKGNDIMDEILEYKKPCFLLEISEIATIESIEELAKKIYSTILK